MADLAECAVCFEPLPAAAPCVLLGSHGRRVCRHFHHLKCMRRDEQYVRRHGGRDLRCPLCNAEYKEVSPLPRRDAVALFARLAPSGGAGLEAHEAKDLLKALLWLDVCAVDELVDGPWQQAVGHSEVADAEELLRLVRMASGSCARRARDAEPPLLVDDPAGWFDFWAAEALVLTRDTLTRALIKTFGTGDEEREELRAAVGAVWGLFCGEAECIGRADFTADDGMADALLAALASSAEAPAPAEMPAPVPPGQWACPRCTLNNFLSDARCAACEAPRPEGMPARAARTAGRLPRRVGGGPGCVTCGAALVAGAVASSGGAEGRPREACSRCRRKPPPGAAIWRCGCGGVLCVRCATVAAPSAESPEWMRPAAAEGPGAAPGSQDQARVPPEVPAPSMQQAVGAWFGAAVGEQGAAPAAPERCPHCSRRRPQPGAPPGRRQQWCLCAVEPSSVWEQLDVARDQDQMAPVQAQTDSPAAAEVTASPSAGEAVRCENCQRPAAPEGWQGINWRRWCQCGGASGEGVREALRTRQLQRSTMLSAVADDVAPAEAEVESPTAEPELLAEATLLPFDIQAALTTEDSG